MEIWVHYQIIACRICGGESALGYDFLRTIKLSAVSNIPLRRVHVTNVAVEKLNVLYISVCVCVCVGGCTGVGVCLRACILNYPVCNALTHCHLWPLWLHHIIRHYLVNGTIFGKKLLNIKYVF